MTVARPFGRDCNTFLAIIFATPDKRGYGRSGILGKSGKDGTISDVHVMSIVWLLMIGNFQGKGIVPLQRRSRQDAGATKWGHDEARPLRREALEMRDFVGC
jgi:hypothetical protein